MLSAGLNIVGFSWITSPAATELETVVLDWLGKMLKLPEDFLSAGMCLYTSVHVFLDNTRYEHTHLALVSLIKQYELEEFVCHIDHDLQFV